MGTLAALAGVVFAARINLANPTNGNMFELDAIAAADVIITCTARYTVGADDFAEGGRRLVIDLGLPRNVDPAVRAVPGVELLDLERVGGLWTLDLVAVFGHDSVVC